MLSKADLVPFKDSVEDQTYTNSCGPHTFCNICEIVYLNAGKPKKFSRSYLWHWGRFYNNGLGTNTGVNFQSVKLALDNCGMCTEEEYPWNMRDSSSYKPIGSMNGFKLARTNFGTDLLSNIKRLICLGIPLAYVFRVTKDFNATVFKGDWRTHQLPEIVAPVQSLHYMTVVGYDDDAQAFLLENSYGPSFGDGGFIGIKYSVFLKYMEELCHIDDFPIYPQHHVGYNPSSPFVTSSISSDWFERAKPYLLKELKNAFVLKDGKIEVENLFEKAIEMGLSSTMVEHLAQWPNGTILKYSKDNPALKVFQRFYFDQR